MTYAPFPVETFSGLNLVDDPLEVGAAGALDLKNVWLEPGRVQSRPALTSFATATRNVLGLGVHASSSGTHVLASEGDGTNATLQAFNGATSIDSTTYASSQLVYAHAFVSIGTTSATATYALRVGDTTRKWDGSAWSTAAGVPEGSSAAPYDGGARLAVGLAGGNDHRVSFSDVGDPETFDPTNFVDVAPGDGEYICDLVSWGNTLFAFKNTKFAVFYGTSTDSDGGAVFNYRMVDNGIGIGSRGTRYAGGACAGPDAVYFFGNDGIYATTGGPPVLVSKAISPLWPSRSIPGYTNVPQVNTQYPDVAWVGDGLYVGASTTAGQSASWRATFVLRNGQWTYLDMQGKTGTATSLAANIVDYGGTPVFASVSSTAIRTLTVNGPPGSATWTYTSGRYALADPGQAVITQESSVVGSGSVALAITTDLYDTLYGSTPATLGTAPATAEGWPAGDQEGTWFQHTLSGTTAASVSRLTHYVRSVRSASVR